MQDGRPNDLHNIAPLCIGRSDRVAPFSKSRTTRPKLDDRYDFAVSPMRVPRQMIARVN
jgi:hypothetical protein